MNPIDLDTLIKDIDPNDIDMPAIISNRTIKKIKELTSKETQKNVSSMIHKLKF
jgi:hypothetical protein